MTWHGTTAVFILGMLVSACGLNAQNAKSKLTQRPWTVVWVQGAEPVGASPATLSFDVAGHLTGSGGCNRLNGDYKLDGNGTSLSIASVSSTRMLCDGAVMRFERTLITSLRTADALNFDKDGRLILTHRGTNVVVLK